MSDVASPPLPRPPLPRAGAANGRASIRDAGGIRRVEVAAGVEPRAWLAGRPERELCYWADRDTEDQSAGAGVLVRVAGSGASGAAPWVERVTDHLDAADRGVRFYGGARFDPSAPPAAEWRAFGAYRFVAPRFEAVRRGGRTLLACNFRPSERDRLPALLAELHGPPAANSGPAAPAPLLLRRGADTPDRAGWEALVRAALRAIDDPADPLTKVVVARRTGATASAPAEAPAPISPPALLQAMTRAGDRSFRFLMQPRPGAAFVSVTPERLFSLRGRSVETEAIAGTRRRGATAADDRRLRRELAASAKDVLEHRIVHDALACALDGLCARTTAGPAGVLALPAVQHLVSRLSGQLAPGVGAADLIDALHPTPAVGGEPAAAARGFLARHEPFDRGWYAAPVGWIGHGEAAFAVAIRSALIDGGAVSFYTGNGVVTGSTPDAEWAELEAKVSGYFAPGA